MPDKVTKYNFPGSETGGVKPMSIRGLFEDERMRLSEEFNDDERKWRKQWLKDQKLSPNEPRPPSEEWIKLTRNPIRRFFSKPFQVLENQMTPVVGNVFATHFRFLFSRTIVLVAGTYLLWYHLKYNQNDWASAHGVRVTLPKPSALPGAEIFPLPRERFNPNDYDDRGFKSRNVYLS